MNADVGVPTYRHKPRQANESIKVLAQISYLTATTKDIIVSLTSSDAIALFDDLAPVLGSPLADGADEISRRAGLFLSAKSDMATDYPSTVLSSIGEAGFDDTFKEGRRVRRTHVSVERNSIIRNMFFERNPVHSCDFCGMDTQKTYPWTDRLLEVHHLLPLCSGTRTSKEGTLLNDLVANCPSCHRAVHRYYDMWMDRKKRIDFADVVEAKGIYEEAKRKYRDTARHMSRM